MPRTSSPHPRISLLGYVLLNLAAGGILAAIYKYASNNYVGKEQLRPFGIAVPLIFTWLCFVAASIYDAIFDRVADRKRKERRTPAHSERD